ncbi:hypothetical protein ITP53_39345 [Nonomuraea sp. K274]|uniref:Uncharacterized protein n=1 Tax=Nonomuraea cypriaca TaxID=1187855 RepID=A0A931AII0_9ACTN|nr:hypothetical protein [Nonomuraea cypriaca]MBF8191649.1 hypothetical protein [Nonomuraea cypriaca]
MTDQYGANLERILRDIERRLQKLETAARFKPGIPIPPPPTASDPGGLDGLTTPADWPSTYNETYGERVTDDLQSIRLYAISIRNALVNGDIFV